MTDRRSQTDPVHLAWPEPSWPHWFEKSPLGLLVLAVVLGSLAFKQAAAFPLIDPTNQDQVPQGSELASPDILDLQHQLQIVNGGGAPAGGGWTFVPHVDYQEMLTDNVLEQNSPRQWDLVSYLSPGFSLVGDLPRLSLNLRYAPTLAIYTRESSLDALTHQLNGIGNITVVPELAFLDVRATAGVNNAYGGVGGVGATDAATPQTAIPSLAGNAQGLTRNNEVQTASIAISPYLLNRFGDWGTGKLGYSLNMTRSDVPSGFLSAPFPTGGAQSQTLVSNEENLHFVTGDILEQIQDTFDADLLQSQDTAEVGSINGFTGLPTMVPFTSLSTREVFSDQITYKFNRVIAVFASGGHEDIVYSGLYSDAIHDLTWSLGTTLTPGPNSLLTVSYGHQNGFNSVTANGYYAVTARTMITLSYGDTLGTQLENLRNQLNLATINGNGTLVNGQTGGQLFGSTNALAVQNGVFRTDTLTVGTQTTLDRDIISLNLLLTRQTSSGAAISSTATAKTVTTTWVHQMQTDMTLNAGLAFSVQDQSVSAGVNPGNSTSVVANLGWQYQISDTLSASLRYSLFERQSVNTSFGFYQNMLILGLSKRF